MTKVLFLKDVYDDSGNLLWPKFSDKEVLEISEDYYILENVNGVKRGIGYEGLGNTFIVSTEIRNENNYE